jgi:hypothetical protein
MNEERNNHRTGQYFPMRNLQKDPKKRSGADFPQVCFLLTLPDNSFERFRRHTQRMDRKSCPRPSMGGTERTRNPQNCFNGIMFVDVQMRRIIYRNELGLPAPSMEPD